MLVQGLAGLGVEAVQPVGRAREGVRRAQDPGALRHDPLDGEARLGREEGVSRVSRVVRVREGGRYARVQGAGRVGGRYVGRDAFGVDQALEEELEARRLAPCTPVQATSPQAYRPGTVVRPWASVRTPPEA